MRIRTSSSSNVFTLCLAENPTVEEVRDLVSYLNRAQLQYALLEFAPECYDLRVGPLEADDAARFKRDWRDAFG